MSVRGAHAVIQCFLNPDEMAILRGDGSVAPETSIEDFPILDDDDGVYTGDFICSSTTAARLLDAYLRTRETAAMGDWEHL